MSDTLTTSSPPGRFRPLRTDTLSDSLLILLVLIGVQRVIGFVRAVLFCRWLRTEDLGQWEMAFGFLMLSAPVGVLAVSSAFRRYVAYYLARGQLRMMIARTGTLCAALAVLSACLMAAGRHWFSVLIFGTADCSETVVYVAVCLLAVIAMHFFVELLSALRVVRLNAGLQLIGGVAFALGGTTLLAVWRCDAQSVIAGYGISCLVAAAWGAWWLRRIWPGLPDSGESGSYADLLRKIVPFSLSVWFTSLLTNLFLVVDRYLLVHCAGLPYDEGLTLVANYHSARLLPLLLVSVLELLGAIIVPHLSNDWEAGSRRRVGQRFRLLLKLCGLGVFAGSAVILFASPVLFGALLAGKFAAGQAVLPWTLAACGWFGLISVAQCYLLCAERAGRVTLARGISLAVSISLNLWLLPRVGLVGAMIAGAAANLISLLLVLAFSRPMGFRADRGTWLTLALPAALVAGPWATLVAAIAVIYGAGATTWLFSEEEKRRLRERALGYREVLFVLARSAPWRRPVLAAADPAAAAVGSASLTTD
jgi:O-antigen/teichoic acid export membrane protein